MVLEKRRLTLPLSPVGERGNDGYRQAVSTTHAPDGIAFVGLRNGGFESATAFQPDVTKCALRRFGGHAARHDRRFRRCRACRHWRAGAQCPRIEQPLPFRLPARSFAALRVRSSNLWSQRSPSPESSRPKNGREGAESDATVLSWRQTGSLLPLAGEGQGEGGLTQTAPASDGCSSMFWAL
jgi:hypothetical protein